MDKLYPVPRKLKCPSGKEIDLSPLIEGAFIMDPKEFENKGRLTDEEVIEIFLKIVEK